MIPCRHRLLLRKGRDEHQGEWPVLSRKFPPTSRGLGFRVWALLQRESLVKVQEKLPTLTEVVAADRKVGASPRSSAWLLHIPHTDDWRSTPCAAAAGHGHAGT
jgi:hypothetical protein